MKKHHYHRWPHTKLDGAFFLFKLIYTAFKALFNSISRR